MAAKKKLRRPTTAGPPKIHEATLASGPSGAVLKGAEIDLATAIERRREGLDVVVCGDLTRANRDLARHIESSIGSAVLQTPHEEAGAASLPHFQPVRRPPGG